MLSENIFELCENNNISIKKLSKLIDIEDSLLYKYVNEKSLPTVNNIVKICNYFDCTIDYLVGLNEKPKDHKILKSYDKSKFFERYSNLLNIHNITHYALSKKLSFSMSSLRTWKMGEIPYLDTLIKLSQFFDVSIDYLIGRSDEI